MLRLVYVALVAVILTSCAGQDCPGADTAPGHVTFSGGARLTVRMADEPEERAQGLMGVTSLPADEGMAFLFGSPTDTTFWMKDTLIPLSIAFTRGSRIVTIREMSPCRSDPCPTYASDRPYDEAFEANRGWFADHGIAEGDRVESFDGPFCR